jgi:hypothetical protein
VSGTDQLTNPRKRAAVVREALIFEMVGLLHGLNSLLLRE